MAEENKIYTGREFIEKCVKKHELLQEKDPEQLQENIRKIEEDKENEIIVEGIQPEDYKGRPYLIETRNWKKVTFTKEVHLEGDFNGILSFENANFNENLTINNFGRKPILPSACPLIMFSNSDILGDVKINRFQGTLSFGMAKISGNFSIRDSFIDSFALNKVEIIGNLIFTSCRGQIHFINTKINGGYYIKTCETQLLYFKQSEVDGAFIVKTSNLKGPADFSDTIFNKGVVFEGCNSSDAVVFADANVTAGDHCLFRGHTFGQAASFKSFKSDIPVTFEKCEFNGPVYFDDITSFKSLKCENSSFAYRMIDMRGVEILDKLVMNDVYFDRAFLLRQREVKRWIGHGKKGQAAVVNDAKTFEFIERALHSSGDYELEDEVYIAKRLSLRKQFDWLRKFCEKAKRFLSFIKHKCFSWCGVVYEVFKYLWDVFNHRCLGYGRRLWPIVWTMLGSIVFFAIWFWRFGVYSDRSILDSFYLSGVTFVTIGYGDTYPDRWGDCLLAIFEGLSGLFLMAVFVVAYARKQFRYK